MRLRRCELSTPASNERMIEKAAGSLADLVFLDLEDSVAPNEKVASRAKVIHALKTLDWGKKTRAVRINDLETEFAYQDIISIVEEAGDYLDVIIIPKVKSAKDVWWVDVLLSQIEKRLQRSRCPYPPRVRPAGMPRRVFRPVCRNPRPSKHRERSPAALAVAPLHRAG